MCSLPPCDKGEEYSAYTLGMDQPPSVGRIWAPDDKARTMAWDVSEQDYLMAGLEQMAPDTTHWKMVPDSPESVAELYEGLHSLVGRKERVHLSRKKGWTGSIVPYTYCTIKSKCHDQSAMRRGRTCQKPGHSCMRKIISWWHHPARPQLRAAGRAAAAWIECLRMSWECASMKTSCSDLRRLWCRACRTAGDDCCRSHCRLCEKVLHSPTVYTADAAQFYEEVRGSDILDTLQLLLQYSEQRGIRSVMLRDSKRRRAYLSPKSHVTREIWTCWPLTRIVALLHLCLCQPFATFQPGCNDKGYRSVALSAGPSAACSWGLRSFDVRSWRKPHCLDTCRPARHDCDMLMTKSGSRLLTATPAWKNSSVKFSRRVSSSRQRRMAQTRRNGWTLLWN